MLLAVQFPFTLLAISLGGVGIQQVIAAYCTLGAFVVLLSNLALLASVVCRRTVAAASLTGGALFMIFAVAPWINSMLQLALSAASVSRPPAWATGLDALATAVTRTSPMTRLSEILRTGFNEPPIGWQVCSNLVMGAACFLVAWTVFETFANERSESGQSRSFKGRARRRSRGRVWKRALAWKDFHFLIGGKRWMLAKFAIYSLPLVAMLTTPAVFGGRPDREAFGGLTLFWSCVVLAFECSFTASSVFHSERKAKTLSTLMMLPMRVRSLAWQKILGCLPALIPAFTYAVIGACCFVPEISDGLRQIRREMDWKLVSVFVYLFLQPFFFLHLVTDLSLRVKRGALPLAVAVMFVLQMLLTIVNDDGPVFMFFAAGSFVVTVLLHRDIGRRLETLAAED
jgi:hypothetical protein